jgi:triosephosphate isomerase
VARALVFAANWKMHTGPAEARAFAHRFLDGFVARADRRYWFFPTAASIEAAAHAFGGHSAIAIGAQNVHWEPKGAFTGETSVPLAAAAGATLVLVGHSERRHLFGETDAQTAKKVRAALGGGLTPLLCVGELLTEREAGNTETVVLRQLHSACDGLTKAELERVAVAYEPVWAIGTGKTATPTDAAAVHRCIRAELRHAGHPAPVVLYGGSVNQANVGALLADPELDGVLVGGASLDPIGWRAITETSVAG